MSQKTITNREQAYQEIKSRIMNGEYEFGEKLNIAALVKEFGLSNSPIREAIGLLENEYLIESTPNAGARVTVMNKARYQNAAITMDMLQQGAYEYCLRTGKKEFLLEVMEESLVEVRHAMQREDKKACLEANMKYWCSFIYATGNELYEKIASKQFDLYLLAEIFNHEDETLDFQKIIRRDEELLQNVRDDEHDKVCTSIFSYKKYHREW